MLELDMSLPVPQLSTEVVVDIRLSFFGLSSDLGTSHYQDAIIVLYTLITSEILICLIGRFFSGTIIFYLFQPKRSEVLAGQIIGVLFSFILPWSSLWNSSTANWIDSFNKGISFILMLFFGVFAFVYVGLKGNALKARKKVEHFLSILANFIYPFCVVVKDVRIFFFTILVFNICQISVASKAKRDVIKKVATSLFPLLFHCSFYSVTLDWRTKDDFEMAETICLFILAVGIAFGISVIVAKKALIMVKYIQWKREANRVHQDADKLKKRKIPNQIELTNKIDNCHGIIRYDSSNNLRLKKKDLKSSIKVKK